LLRICAVRLMFVRESCAGTYKVIHAAGDVMRCKAKRGKRVGEEFGRARSTSGQARTADSGSKLPHST